MVLLRFEPSHLRTVPLVYYILRIISISKSNSVLPPYVDRTIKMIIVQIERGSLMELAMIWGSYNIYTSESLLSQIILIKVRQTYIVWTLLPKVEVFRPKHLTTTGLRLNTASVISFLNFFDNEYYNTIRLNSSSLGITFNTSYRYTST